MRKISKYGLHAAICVAVFFVVSGEVVSQQSATPSYDFELNSFSTGSDASFRGLSVVDKNCIWASGSKGTVIKTTNGGKSWTKYVVKDWEELEFRDIHAFDSQTALILSAGTPGLVLKTIDGGKSWTEQFKNENPKIFFDAFSFWDGKNGIGFSDPIDNRLVIIRSNDGGKSWRQNAPPESPKTLEGEAGFAASGTCLATHGDGNVWIGLGGRASQSSSFARVVYSRDGGKTWKASSTPIRKSESAGVFSLTFVDSKTGFAIGGDYLKPELNRDIFCTTSDGGSTWTKKNLAAPKGFRSCIAYGKLGKNTVLVTTGTNGTEASLDLGESWGLQQKTGFHVIEFDKDRDRCTGWLAGGNGKVARFEIRPKR